PGGSQELSGSRRKAARLVRRSGWLGAESNPERCRLRKVLQRSHHRRIRIADLERRAVPGAVKTVETISAPLLGRRIMNVLAVDIGGTNVKVLATGQTERRKFPSGPTMTPEMMVAGVKHLAADWRYDVVSIGYPGRVHAGHIVADPHNLGAGWVRFDFEAA